MSGHVHDVAAPLLPWDALTGPGVIPCEERCEVPEGVTLLALPGSRHAWPGIINCPNGCGRCFEVHRDADNQARPK